MDDLTARFGPIIDALKEKHGVDIVLLDLRDISGFTDAFLIATARSEVNARALLDAAEDALEATGRTYKIEGGAGAKWSLVDAGDIIVHIFTREGREFYKLEERHWGDAPTIKFEDE